MDSLDQVKQAWDQQLNAHTQKEKKAKNAAESAWYCSSIYEFIRIEANRVNLLRWVELNSNESREATSTTCSLAKFAQDVLPHISGDINYKSLNCQVNGADLARAMDKLWREHTGEQDLHYPVGSSYFTSLNTAFLDKCQKHFEASATAAGSKYVGDVREDVASLYLERFEYAAATKAQTVQFRAAVEQVIDSKAVLSNASILEATKQLSAAPKAAKKRPRAELELVEQLAAACEREQSCLQKIQQLQSDLEASRASEDPLTEAIMSTKDREIRERDDRLVALEAEVARLKAQLCVLPVVGHLV